MNNFFRCVYSKIRGLAFVVLLASRVLPALSGCGTGDDSGDDPGDGVDGVGTLELPLTAVTLTAFAAGGNHTCAALADGRLLCWGANGSGQLGDLTTVASTLPKLIGRASVTGLAAGWAHTCALYADRTVTCWGLNDHGQLADGTTTNRLAPTPVAALTDVAEIAAGHSHTCARLTNSSLKCWGHNAFGQLGTGNTTDLKWATTTTTSGVAQISAAEDSTFLLDTDGTVRATGRNTGGELANGTTVPRNTFGTIVGLTGVAQVAAGSGFACGRLTAGTIKCWGNNFFGQLGDGTTTRRLTPTAVPGLTGVTQIAAGQGATYAALFDGGARSWGGDASMSRLSPGPIAGLSGVARFSASSHACAQLAQGEMRCWGSNGSGQIGDGTTVVKTLPISPNFPGAPPAVVAHAAGWHTTCAALALADNNLRCWGGSSGATKRIPRVVNLPDRVVELAAGAGHMCAVLANKHLYCWGANDRGQLGIGVVTATRPLPIRVPGLTGVTHVAAGFYSTCAVHGDAGLVRCWGANDFGQLGFETMAPEGQPKNQLTSKSVPGLANIIRITAGNFGQTMYALRDSDRLVLASGSNAQGNLGFDLDLRFRTSFQQVPGIGNVQTIAAGGNAACAIVGPGILRCWGSAGQIGYLTPDGAPSHTPQTVSLPQFVTAIAMGDIATYVVLADGTGRSWGGDSNGCLGNGNVEPVVSTPVPMYVLFGLTDLASLSGGYWNPCAVNTQGVMRCWGDNWLGTLGTNSMVPTFTNFPIEPLL